MTAPLRDAKVRHHSRTPDTPHLLTKGDDMAVSKHSRPSGCETNPFFLELFREGAELGERERVWHTAISHIGESNPSLRFPVYEALYLINAYSQKLVDLLEEVGKRFGIDSQSREYHQSMVQMVRASASQSITDYMNDVEITEEWLFEQLWIKEQRKLRDPDDAYLEVRRQEAGRIEQGLPPRVRFVDESTKTDSPKPTGNASRVSSIPDPEGQDE